MNIKFAKALLMGSVLTMGAFGLVACGDDASSNPSTPQGPAPIVVPTTQDNIIIFSTLNMVDAGSVVKLTGSVSLNATDTLSSTAPENIKFTDVSFQVGKVTPSGLQTTSATASVATPKDFVNGFVDRMTFAEMGIMVDLADPALTECGEFQLIVTAKATDGIKDFENTQTVAFKRPDAYCAAAPASSSSSVEPTAGVTMTICPEISMSTNMLPGLDLATCTATASTTADIVLVKSAGDFNITSGNGTLFSPIDNETMTPNNYKDDYGVGYWPEVVNGRDALMSDFKYKAITGTEIVKVNENYSANIFVAKTAAFNEATGAGFFAFAVTKASEGNNSDFNVTLKVYKAK